MKHRVAAFVAGIVLFSSGAARAADRWEFGQNSNDDFQFTHNELTHGSVQYAHDLQTSTVTVADDDWMVLRAKARHSYEARVGSGTTIWTVPGCAGCARFDRVDSVGNILTEGVADGAIGLPQPDTLSVRFIAPANATEYLRVRGQPGWSAVNTYDIELHDTTYFLPRFNNSATQITILIVQNATDSPVDGQVYFYNENGGLLHTHTMLLAPQATLVLNSSTIGALAGKSGSVAIAHTGPAGALTGKGVALEQTTGFTFDTALTPVPR